MSSLKRGITAKSKSTRAKRCKIHGVPLVCVSCIGAKGGKQSAKKFTRKQRSEWGKKGGRGHSK